MGTRHSWSQERELQKRLVQPQRGRHEHEHGQHGHEVLEHHNKETVVGIDVTEAWDGYNGGRVGRGATVKDRQFIGGRSSFMRACDRNRGCVAFAQARGQDHPKK